MAPERTSREESSADRPAPREQEAAPGPSADAEALLREVEDALTGLEGEAGEGDDRSGTVPGSVGGTTGTSGRSGGVQTPGARVSTLRGIDPREARRRLRLRDRESRE